MQIVRRLRQWRFLRIHNAVKLVILIPLAALTLAREARPQSGEPRLINGVVRDSAGVPIWLAIVQTVTHRRVATDDSGRFRIRTGRNEVVRLDIRRIGFRPAVVELRPGADTTLEIRLEAVALMLGRTNVAAEAAIRSLELRGFYRRMNDGERGILNGEFIGPEEIDQRKPPRISWMVDGRQGVRVRKAKDQNPQHWEVIGPGGCTMTIFLDGIRLNRLGSSSNLMPDYLDEIVGPTTVAGIEVYGRAGRVPAEYQSLIGPCGVILIWTR